METDPTRHEQAVRETVSAMEDAQVKAIYEASFSYDEVRVRVDILSRLGRGKWSLIEVKSSTKVKNEYLPDVGVQYHVLKGSGLEIDRVILRHPNNQYVYDGHRLDLKSLFISVSPGLSNPIAVLFSAGADKTNPLEGYSSYRRHGSSVVPLNTGHNGPGNDSVV